MTSRGSRDASVMTHLHKRDMCCTATFSFLILLAFTSEVSADVDPTEDEEQRNVGELSTFLSTSRKKILAAQFQCYLKIIRHPPRNDEGHFCNRTWDGWLCWGDSPPGTVSQPCPDYFLDFDPAEKVTKVCDPDGRWFHHPESNRVWTNYTQCTTYTNDKLKIAMSVYYLAMVGQSLSIVSLFICLVIFSYLKSLSCQRISLHKNMFLSFILNSVVTIIWLPQTVAVNQASHVGNPVGCRVLAMLIQYTSTSNYFWMLCEGIYLHTLIIVAVFMGEQQLFWYYVLGWGFPIFPAITYAVARSLFYNDRCWISSQTHLLYITHGPICAALLVNLVFLLNIIRVLIIKLKQAHCAESMTYMKAARATLILIPLLGVQFISWMPEGRISQAIYFFSLNILWHFQGLLVAIIFCFCNAEAQTALRRKWTQWKSAWGKTGWGLTPTAGSHCNHHANSITETSRATITVEQQLARPAPESTDNGVRAAGERCQNGDVTTNKQTCTVFL